MIPILSGTMFGLMTTLPCMMQGVVTVTCAW